MKTYHVVLGISAVIFVMIVATFMHREINREIKPLQDELEEKYEFIKIIPSEGTYKKGIDYRLNAESGVLDTRFTFLDMDTVVNNKTYTYVAEATETLDAVFVITGWAYGNVLLDESFKKHVISQESEFNEMFILMYEQAKDTFKVRADRIKKSLRGKALEKFQE